MVEGEEGPAWRKGERAEEPILHTASRSISQAACASPPTIPPQFLHHPFQPDHRWPIPTNPNWWPVPSLIFLSDKAFLQSSRALTSVPSSMKRLFPYSRDRNAPSLHSLLPSPGPTLIIPHMLALALLGSKCLQDQVMSCLLGFSLLRTGLQTL